eukprot:COSAG03_NODE_7532_length_904_cov_1.571429_1_plen_43_part_10
MFSLKGLRPRTLVEAFFAIGWSSSEAGRGTPASVRSSTKNLYS